MSGFRDKPRQGGGAAGGGGASRPHAERTKESTLRSNTGSAIQNADPVRYFENDRIRPALFGREAVEAAQAMSGIDPTQIRRFFGSADRLRRRLAAPGASISAEELSALLALLRMRALYAAARDTKHEPLARFVSRHVQAVTQSGQPHRAFLEGFYRQFEAVIGFHKALKAGLSLEGIG
jgi:CRISPR type III-A-associated protein Csm2